MIELVPAPGRQFKTYSMWLGIAIGSVDALLLLVKAFGDLHLLSTTAVLAINAVLAFLIVPAKLVFQSIPVTTSEKVDLVTTAAALPMKAEEPNVEVQINVAPLPDTPAPPPSHERTSP